MASGLMLDDVTFSVGARYTIRALVDLCTIATCHQNDFWYLAPGTRPPTMGNENKCRCEELTVPKGPRDLFDDYSAITHHTCALFHAR